MSDDVVERLNAALSARYEVQAEAGKGAMATVYRARDIRHNRDVALKVLRPEVAAALGAERFLAEIETTANLQHPHILPLYDSGEADGFLFYVMPYVDGETLRERLDRDQQLPIDEAVHIAVAVAHALEYAHRQGVVHRDIKPGNVLLQAGEPVVGDFGIALALGAAGPSRLTESGISVGTPYYMSPEQATGDMAVGPASDVFALGAVLYELLTGEPPYTGRTQQAVLGRIIQGAPVPTTRLRRSVPPNVDAAIRKALETLAADRFTRAGDFAKALEDPSFRYGVAPGGERVGVGGALRWAAVGFIAAAAVLAIPVGQVLRRPEASRAVERFAAPFLEGQEPEVVGYTLSPDGTMLVYRRVVGNRSVLMVRRWDDLVAAPVRQTEGAASPAVSPDGLELAFVQNGEVRVLAFGGGPVRTLVRGGAPRWGPDGYVYASTDSGTVRVRAAGGAAEVVTRLAEGETAHFVYDFLPDGRHALMFAQHPGQPSGPADVRTVDLQTGEMRQIVPGLAPKYLPSGYLVYGDGAGTMMAARFDAKRAELSGTPVPVLDNLTYWSLSDGGKLFYTTGGTGGRGAAGGQLLEPMWVSRSGETTPVDRGWTFVKAGPDIGWRISPDGSRVALRERTSDGADIWIKQLDRGPRSRLTFGTADELMPTWGPGAGDVTFLSDRGGDLDVWTRRADGTGEARLVLDFELDVASASWSPDGTWLVVRTSGTPGLEGSRDIYAFRPGTDTEPAPLIAAPGYDELSPEISPDGRFIAYQSTETGRHEIYVRPFPDVNAGRWQVSVDGGRNPRWARGGRELFFQGPAREMMAVDVRTSPSFTAGTPRVLFENEPGWAFGDLVGNQYDVAPDDQRFLMARRINPGSDGDAPTVVLVNNFGTELDARVPR